jgi:hypothetical protein
MARLERDARELAKIQRIVGPGSSLRPEPHGPSLLDRLFGRR